MMGWRGAPVGVGEARNGWIRAWGLRIRLRWSTAVLVEAGSGRGDGGTAMAGAPAGEEEEGEGEENERREEGDDGQGVGALISGEVRSPEAGGDEAAGSGARVRAQEGAARSRALGRQGGSGGRAPARGAARFGPGAG